MTLKPGSQLKSTTREERRIAECASTSPTLYYIWNGFPRPVFLGAEGPNPVVGHDNEGYFRPRTLGAHLLVLILFFPFLLSCWIGYDDPLSGSRGSRVPLSTLTGGK